MNRLLKSSVIAATVLFAGAAQAELSGSISLVSDYRFRGISQSGEEAAVQGGFEYFHDSGLYAGWYGSSVDYAAAGDEFDNNESIEHTLYAGYFGELNENTTYDLTFNYYLYPGSVVDVDYSEIIVGMDYKSLRVAYAYADDYYQTGEAYSYIEANYRFELPEEFGLVAHAGYSFGDVFDDTSVLWLDEYVDYSLTVEKSYAGVDFSLAYMDTDIDSEFSVKDDYLANEDTFVLSVSKSF